MHLNYNKLWKLLIDMGMNKQDLRNDCGVSGASVAKLAKGQNVTTDILLRICKELKCDIGDICEVVWDPEDTEESSEQKGSKSEKKTTDTGGSKRIKTMRLEGSGRSSQKKDKD